MAAKSYRGEVETQIPLLRHTARALVGTGHADTADEMVHDVLVHALKTERNWLGEDIGLRLFARLVVVNRSRLRAAQSERRSGYPVQSGATGALHRPVLHESIGAESHDGGSGPLGRLTLDEREALALVVLGRLDHAIAAQALGIPVATLVSRLSQARDRLGSQLWRSPTAVPAASPLAQRTSTRSTAHLRLVKS